MNQINRRSLFGWLSGALAMFGDVTAARTTPLSRPSHVPPAPIGKSWSRWPHGNTPYLMPDELRARGWIEYENLPSRARRHLITGRASIYLAEWLCPSLRYINGVPTVDWPDACRILHIKALMWSYYRDSNDDPHCMFMASKQFGEI